MNFRVLRNIAAFFLICSAVVFMFFNLGELPSLPKSFELTWLVNQCNATPISLDEESRFVNTFGLYKAAYDPRVKALNIVLRDVHLGAAHAQEMVRVVYCFKSQGKCVNIYSSRGLKSWMTILLASGTKRCIADGVDIALPALTFQSYFYRNRLRKKKIEVWSAQGGEFKGGFSFDLDIGFSFDCASNLRGFLLDLEAQEKELLAYSLGVKNVEPYFDKVYFNTNQAKEFHLVDEISSFKPDKRQVSLKNYASSLLHENKYAKHVVAVVAIDFVIAGSYCYFLADELFSLARDESVKVVVLYINSPGGVSNDTISICDAIVHLKNEGKYVIALIDECAASAAYWVASYADKIFTNCASCVGSIGVYTGTHDDTAALEKKGITYDVVSTNEEFLGKHLSFKQKEFIEKTCQEQYEAFKAIVQANRNLTGEVVDDAARGQIYTGLAAYNIGLVDSVEGFAGALMLVHAICEKKPFVFRFIPWSYYDDR